MSQIQQQAKVLPQTKWNNLLLCIKKAGEYGAINDQEIAEDYFFWEKLGIFVSGVPFKLTETGRMLFESVYIKRDGGEKEIFKQLLLLFPPTIAIQQYLWGVANVGVEQVLSVLKMTGFWLYDSREPLTHFLDFLNYAEIVSYNKKNRTVKVLVSPDLERIPQNIFIDPLRPFSNIVWIKRLLGECERSIFWLDKHFQKEGLEWLWSVADAQKISEIKILSLDLGHKNIGSDTRKYYRRFKQEMANKGITVLWATIDIQLIRDAHDRWIFDGVGSVWNIPNVNAISSGQRSELNKTNNYKEAKEAFDSYWVQGVEV